jgi:hypothetical protein
MKPPFSFERFIQNCDGIIDKGDIDVLKSVSAAGQANHEAPYAALKKWRLFDTMLRNELVRIRAARKKTDPVKYIREDGYTEPDIAHIALHAYRTLSILDAEKILDEARWGFLEASAAGHYFDIDSLIIYAAKLLILERWERINMSGKEDVLNGVLE